MRKLELAIVLFLGAAAAVFAQKPGPVADTIYLNAQSSRSAGLDDTISGKADIFICDLNGGSVQGLSSESLSKLDLYSGQGGIWSILINPAPNTVSYQVRTASGETRFNPFAIREVRYALNWLIDRRRVVNSALRGSGEALFTPVPALLSGSALYDGIAARLGMTENGSEQLGLSTIDKAMRDAAKLSANRGRLVESGGIWSFDGKPVTVSFVIRADDPALIEEGRYIADQIEKSGIMVEQLDLPGEKAEALVRESDPADFEWCLYTESWAVPAHRDWQDIAAEYYAPCRGRMAGGTRNGGWKYQNPQLDSIASKTGNGWFLTPSEYRDDCALLTQMGLNDAARIFVASPIRYSAANKARMRGRMTYDIGEGLDGWSLRSADVQPERGQAEIKAELYTPDGSIFDYSWNPMSADGFGGAAAVVAGAVSDRAAALKPNNGADLSLRGQWNTRDVFTRVSFEEAGGAPGSARPAGLIQVPESALIFNSYSGEWVGGVSYVIAADGSTSYQLGAPAVTQGGAAAKAPQANAAISAYSQVKTGYLYGTWHSGEKMNRADLLYTIAFRYDWATRDGSDDTRYDANYGLQYRSWLSMFKGAQINQDGTVTAYYDCNWPMDIGAVASKGVLEPLAGPPLSPAILPWELYEAVSALVSEGSKSGTAYSFSRGGGRTEISLLEPLCVADIRDKLESFIKKQYVPASISRWTNLSEAVSRYRADIAFIDAHHNAYISNGPFYISGVDSAGRGLELSAFRATSYPYKADFWGKTFRQRRVVVSSIDAPASANRGRDIQIEVSAEILTFPDDVALPADNTARIQLELVGPDGRTRKFAGQYSGKGSFTITVPGRELAAIPAGSCFLIVSGSFADPSSRQGDYPSVARANLTLY